MNEKTVYTERAEIDGLNMEIGIGQAIFDNPDNPTYRYFLEKRWGIGGNVLGAIMMNPSKAGNVESDKTVNRLIDYAKNCNYSALFVINVSPYIESDSSKLNMKNDKNYDKNKQIKCFEYVLQNSNYVYIGWGSKGHPFFKRLLKNNKKIESLFLSHIKKFRAIKLGDAVYPAHPSSRTGNGLNKETILDDVSSELKCWIKQI